MPSLESDDYVINIKTKANTSGATEATDALKKVGNETKEVDDKSKSASGGMGSLVGQFALGNIAANVASSAFSAVKGQLTDTIQVAEQQQNVQAQLNNTLKASKDASGMTIEGLTGIADQTQKTTTYSKLDTEQAENVMLTYTNIGKNVFPQTMTAAENMATRFGIDLPNAAKLLGRALNDPAHGMTALTRYLGTLSPAMQKNIKDMEASGNAAGAQALLISLLNQKMGGAATTAAQTFSGKMAQIKNRIEDLKISIGTHLIDAFMSMAKWFEKITQDHKFQEFMKEVGKIVKEVGQYFERIAQVDIKIFLQVWNILERAIKMLMPSISALKNALVKDLGSSIKEIIATVERLWKELNPALLDVLKVVAAIIGGVVFAAIWLLINTLNVVVGVINFVIHALGDLIGWIANFLRWIGEAIGVIGNFGATLIYGLMTLPQRILSAVSNFGTLLYDAGKNLIEGLIHGVTDMIGKAVDKVKNVGKSIINGAKDIFKIFSPSHVFHEIGLNVGAGLINGMAASQTGAAAASSALANSAIQGATGSLGSGTVNNSSSTTMNSSQSQIQIGQIVLPGVSDAHDFMQAINNDSILVKNGLTPSQGAA